MDGEIGYRLGWEKDMNNIWETLTLGDWISQLQRFDQNSEIKFDFGLMLPTTLASYRGFYEHLALGFRIHEQFKSTTEVRGNLPTVKDLLEDAIAADGKIFGGYKGGGYRMDRNTPVWVSNIFDATGTTILGLVKSSYSLVIIRTAWTDI